MCDPEYDLVSETKTSGCNLKRLSKKDKFMTKVKKWETFWPNFFYWIERGARSDSGYYDINMRKLHHDLMLLNQQSFFDEI